VFFIAFPILALGGTVFSKLFSRHTLTADPQRLSLRSHGMIFSRTRSIPTEELEELEYFGPKELPPEAKKIAFLAALAGGNGTLVARSDREKLVFGEGLSPDELRWMREVILKAVTAPAVGVVFH
jgi:hypothetical protein